MKTTAAAFVLCCATASLLTHGCTFAMLDGKGSQDRTSVAVFLPSASTNQIAQWKEEISSPPPPLGRYTEKHISSGPSAGCTSRTMNTPCYAALVGPYHARSLSTPDDPNSGKRTTLTTMDTWGTMFPFLAAISNTRMSCYDEQTAECITSGHFFTLTVLLTYGKIAAPADKQDAKMLNEIKPCDIKYDRLTGCCIGCGALAFGQKNNRAYLQIAWIPIPLWSY